jgi:hypothetical protein
MGKKTIKHRAFNKETNATIVSLYYSTTVFMISTLN